MHSDSRIFVAGHRGLVGAALVRRCRQLGCDNLLLRTRQELDLRDQAATDKFFAATRPEYVFMAAGRVGGIGANAARPADFIRDNLQMATNVIHSAWRHGTSKLLYLGSSCIYPKLAPQPLREDYLLTGALEGTNEWYAIAKLAGIKMGQAYRQQFGFNVISALPTNLYGPGDNFDLENSHVLPALIRKIDTAREQDAEAVTLWGTGAPLREFLFVDDLADACMFLMKHYESALPINLGCGQDITIRELAQTVARRIGFTGRVDFDPSRPDGTPRKVLDVSRMTALGWQASTSLEEGLRITYDWYRTANAHQRTDSLQTAVEA